MSKIQNCECRIKGQDVDTRDVHNLNVGDSDIEWLKEFKYLGTLINNENNIQEEINNKTAKQ